MAYGNTSLRPSVSVGSVTPVKLFSTNTATRVGWRCVLPTTVTAGVGIRFQVQTAGSTAPTAANMLIGCSVRAEAGAIVIDECNAQMDIYAVAESGGPFTIQGEEILA
jgi:hypothetical protein